MKRHTPLRRTPFKQKSWIARSATERPKKPPTPQQVRKRAQDAEYAVNRRLKLIQVNYRCERIYEVDSMRVRCSRAASQTHHKLRRSQQVDHSLDNLLALCPQCHEYIHLNVADSKARGYIVSLSDTSKEPLIDSLDTGE